jgi:hypothetical protein
MTELTPNQKLHEQMVRDNRIPSSLVTKPGANYDQNDFEGAVEDALMHQRPTRDKPKSLAKNSNISTGKPDSNFEGRKQISIDENDDTITGGGQLEAIMQRGARL